MSFLGSIVKAVAAPVVGGLFGSSSAKDQAKASAAASQADRDFQERMSRNAHTYEVEDLKRAGLNPILSANKGATTPGGSTAVVPSEADAVSKTASTALQAALAHAQIDNVKADTKLKEAGAASAYEQADLTKTTNVQKSRFSPVYKAIGDLTEKGVSSARDVLRVHVPRMKRNHDKFWEKPFWKHKFSN